MDILVSGLVISPKVNDSPNPVRMYYIKNTPRLFESIVDTSAGQIIHHKELPRTQHAPVDRIEMNEAAQVALADESVKRELERLQLGDNVVVLDPWDYGKDDENERRRLTQIFFYTRKYVIHVLVMPRKTGLHD